MKDRQIYKKLQKMVIASDTLTAEEKIAMLRLLFEQEDLALHIEAVEGKAAEDGAI